MADLPAHPDPAAANDPTNLNNEDADLLQLRERFSAGENIHPDLLAQVDQYLGLVSGLLLKPYIRKPVRHISGGPARSANLASNHPLSGSIAHIASSAAALMDVLDILDDILKGNASMGLGQNLWSTLVNGVVTADQETSFTFLNFLAKLRSQAAGKISDGELTQFSQSLEDWQWIKTTLQATTQIYLTGPEGVAEETRIRNLGGLRKEADRNIKAYSIVLERINGEEVIVVAIRGSKSGVYDWPVNFNHVGVEYPWLNTGTRGQLWHKGLSRTAKQLASLVCNDLRELYFEKPHPQKLVFTGHSAGGAFAQIFRTASKVCTTQIFQTLDALGIQAVDCITFAAPPITNIPIPYAPNERFWNIINEGDPVVLLQLKYIKPLLQVFVLTGVTRNAAVTVDEATNRLIEEVQRDVTVPLLDFRPNGKCVLLRSERGVVQAFCIRPEMLVTKLFGNGFAHLTGEYRKRVDKIWNGLPRAAARGHAGAVRERERSPY